MSAAAAKKPGTVLWICRFCGIVVAVDDEKAPEQCPECKQLGKLVRRGRTS